MNIKELKLFYCTAEEHNLTRAAARNGYTQSAASHILKNFEQELGFPVFRRSQRGLELTQEGHKLFPYAQKVLSELDEFEREVSQIKLAK